MRDLSISSSGLKYKDLEPLATNFPKAVTRLALRGSCFDRNFLNQVLSNIRDLVLLDLEPSVQAGLPTILKGSLRSLDVSLPPIKAPKPPTKK